MPFLPLLLALQQPVARAAKDVKDPGVVVTGQRVAPAGVQTVFDGRVSGVRFGASSEEVWVAVPGSVVKLDWANNRVAARAPLNGRPGVYAVAFDQLTKRVMVSFVSNTPATNVPGQTRSRALAILHVFDGNASGDSVLSRSNSGVLGDFMAGGPAIAARPDSATGRRLAVLPLPANDELAILDANSGALQRGVALGVEPIASVISSDSRTAYVSILGGPKPAPSDWSAPQCCDVRSEAVRVDERGIAANGSVARVDLESGTLVKNIEVGRHPTSIVWNEGAALLFVADGNSDTVSVIDTRTDALATRIAIAPFRDRRIGLAPTALALSPDARTLYVALGGVNAVAMYDVTDVRAAKLLGMIPTAWYPASLDASADGKYLAIGALLGVGSGVGKAGGSGSKVARYVHSVRGSVNVVPVPGSTELAAYTTAVAENNRLPLAGSAAASVAPRANVAARAVPERPGEASLINHVVFIVRENRTFDQVLGDHVRGARDSSLVIFGKDVTPNTHALAERYVTLDHFFASGGNSADGHQWLTQANETEYPMWPLYYGRSYPSEGEDPIAYSSGGFLWEAAQNKGKTVTIFGEYAPGPKTNSPTFRAASLAKYNEAPKDYDAMRKYLATRYNTTSSIPSLDKALVREYPGWTLEVPDVMKAGDILAHLKDWETAKAMPNLIMVILPSDHTSGTSAGWCTPKACVADNDYATGLIVEGLSRSSFWKDMAIFVVEDDAQDGVDHVDGHRTVALAISPFARRGIVDSTFYSQPSMVKTIELMLGLPSMSIFDLVATDMRASFISPTEKPDLTPYTALVPKQSITETNQRVGQINGPFAKERRLAARQSAKMDFDDPDEAPSDLLNRILWHNARGYDTPYPGVRQSLFFPLAIHIEDADRKVKK